MPCLLESYTDIFFSCGHCFLFHQTKHLSLGSVGCCFYYKYPRPKSVANKLRYLPTIKKKSVLFKVVFMMSTANYVERKKKKLPSAFVGTQKCFMKALLYPPTPIHPILKLLIPTFQILIDVTTSMIKVYWHLFNQLMLNSFGLDFQVIWKKKKKKKKKKKNACKQVNNKVKMVLPLNLISTSLSSQFIQWIVRYVCVCICLFKTMCIL